MSQLSSATLVLFVNSIRTPVTSLLHWYCLLSWFPIIAECSLYQGCYGSSGVTYCFISTGRDDNTGNNFLLPYSNSSAWCQSQGLKLLTIETEDKHRAVLDFMLDHEYNTDAVWLGGGQHNLSWVWVNGSKYTGESVQTIPVANQSSVPPFSAYLKITSSTSSSLISDSSKESRGYICQFPKSLCQSLKQVYDNADKHALPLQLYKQDSVVKSLPSGDCYIIYPVDNPRADKSWYDARSICLHHGGDLATDIEPIRTQMDKTSVNKGYWVGLQRDPLWWNDRDTTNSMLMKYSAFPRLSPSIVTSDSCLILLLDSRHWTFGVQNCFEKALFICDDVIKNSTNTTSAQELYGPVTKEIFIGVIVASIIFYILSVIVAVIITFFCTKRCNRPVAKPSPQQHMNNMDVRQNEQQGQQQQHANNINNNNNHHHRQRHLATPTDINDTVIDDDIDYLNSSEWHDPNPYTGTGYSPDAPTNCDENIYSDNVIRY